MKRYTLEEKLDAVALVRDGRMSYREAGRACGIPFQEICKWRHQLEDPDGDLYAFVPRDPDGKRGRTMDQDGRRAGFPDDLPDDVDELKQIILRQQFEIDLREAVLDILKKDPGARLESLSNREKAILVSALREKGTYSLGWMMSSLGLARATYHYHARRIGRDPDAELAERVRRACGAHPEFGYRRIKRLIGQEEGFEHVSEKRVRRIMRREGLSVSRRRRSSRYSSYSERADTSELPNAPLRADGSHDFSAEAPDRLWLTDVTEFPLPSGARVYLSPILDCFDGSLPAWRISLSEKSADLTDPMLEEAARGLAPGSGVTIHTDRGGQYHAESWKRICAEHGIARSMSRKGHSPDNARMEGFFGRLKMEFFDTRDWRGCSAGSFMRELDGWLRYYNEERPKQSLGWMSPLQYRASLGYSA